MAKKRPQTNRTRKVIANKAGKRTRETGKPCKGCGEKGKCPKCGGPVCPGCGMTLAAAVPPDCTAFNDCLRTMLAGCNPGDPVVVTGDGLLTCESP